MAPVTSLDGGGGGVTGGVDFVVTGVCLCVGVNDRSDGGGDADGGGDVAGGGLGAGDAGP